MFNKSEIFQKIDELASWHTDSAGRFDLHAVEDDLACFLHINRQAIDVERLASDYVTSFDRAKRPKFLEKQLSLFAPDAWIPIGNKQRVQMKFINRDDIIAWAGLEISEHTSSSTAHARKMEYINSRLQVWDADRYKTLAELEAEKFNGV
jgi:hypothetical protein